VDDQIVTLNLTPQEYEYIVQLLATRPLQEVLPLYLKITNQRITPEVQDEGLRVVP
jgi:hypothetical protein